ncbi:Neutral protease [Metarhizium anisopliae]|nr:Neutral protease [Metarhizium anisopliae]
MGHILVVAAFTFAAVTASSIPDRPTTLPLTLPIVERSEQPITCLTGIKRSPEPINGKRGIEQNCGRSQRDVTRAFSSCAAKAQKGREAALKGGELMKTLFKNDDEDTRKRVADHFEQIASQCGARENSGVSVNCGQCEQGIAGKAFKGSGPITLCSVALADTESTTQCGGQDLDDVLLHEMSHVLGSTDDLGYGLEAFIQSSLGPPH